MKYNRHAKIIELIEKNQIETQDELADLLKQEGFHVTQATISRDIRDLKLTKLPADNGKQYYALHRKNVKDANDGGPENTDKYIRVLRGGYVSSALAGNILVVKTSAGMASAVCAVIDHLSFEEIVGSIAGDDTIMCATRSEADAQAVMNRLERMAL